MFRSGSTWGAEEMRKLRIFHRLDAKQVYNDKTEVTFWLSVLTDNGFSVGDDRVGPDFSEFLRRCVGNNEPYAKKPQDVLAAEAGQFGNVIISLATVTQPWAASAVPVRRDSDSQGPKRPVRAKAQTDAAAQERDAQALAALVGPATPERPTQHTDFTPRVDSKMRSKPEFGSNMLAIAFLQAAINSSKLRAGERERSEAAGEPPKPQVEWEPIPTSLRILFDLNDPPNSSIFTNHRATSINDGSLVLKGLATAGDGKAYWMKRSEVVFASLEVCFYLYGYIIR